MKQYTNNEIKETVYENFCKVLSTSNDLTNVLSESGLDDIACAANLLALTRLILSRALNSEDDVEYFEVFTAFANEVIDFYLDNNECCIEEEYDRKSEVYN